jgi:hypothetical protein
VYKCPRKKLGLPEQELNLENENDLFPTTYNNFRRRRKSDVKKDHLPNVARNGVGPNADDGMGGNAQ